MLSLLIAAHPSFPASTIQELIVTAKPDALNVAGISYKGSGTAIRSA